MVWSGGGVEARRCSCTRESAKGSGRPILWPSGSLRSLACRPRFGRVRKKGTGSGYAVVLLRWVSMQRPSVRRTSTGVSPPSPPGADSRWRRAWFDLATHSSLSPAWRWNQNAGTRGGRKPPLGSLLGELSGCVVSSLEAGRSLQPTCSWNMMERQQGLSEQLKRMLAANSACDCTDDVVRRTSDFRAHLQMPGWQLGTRRDGVSSTLL